MKRNSWLWIPLFLLVLVLALTGCFGPKSATPGMGDEADVMSQSAEANTTQTPAATPLPPTATLAPATPIVATPEVTTVVATAEPTAVVTPEVTAQPVATGTQVTPALTPVVTPAPTTPGAHVVQAGENLFRIALRYGVDMTALAKANNITNPARIYVGQKLTIPAAGTTPGGGTTPPPSGDAKVHVVQTGENLFRIALKYNYDYLYLARFNNITNPTVIYPGQKIRIP